MSSNSNTEQPGNGFFEIRPYKIGELAKLYTVGIKTFKRWIAILKRKLGLVKGHYLSINQVEIILAHLKLPYKVKVELIDENNFDKILESKIKAEPKATQKKVSSPNNRNPKKKKIKTSKTFRRKAHKDRLNKKAKRR